MFLPRSSASSRRCRARSTTRPASAASVAAAIEVDLDRGVLTIAGERKSTLPARDEKTALHINERFAGRFRRVVSLPDDIDPNAISADYRDGVLHVSIQRKASAQPRRVTVQ